jgi:hypothetical protein
MSDVRIVTGLVELEGDLRVPPGAQAVVLLAQAGTALPVAPRDGRVRDELAVAGIATLVVDLVTPQERQLGPGHVSSEVSEHADRLSDALDVVLRHPETRHLPPGCLATQSAVAAAFVAAARRPATVAAIVSHEGRVDLAGAALDEVMAPTMLIVGAEEHVVRGLNEDAYERLRCRKRLELIPGATLPSPGDTRTLEMLALLAKAWFRRFLTVEREP